MMECKTAKRQRISSPSQQPADASREQEAQENSLHEDVEDVLEQSQKNAPSLAVADYGRICLKTKTHPVWLWKMMDICLKTHRQNWQCQQIRAGRRNLHLQIKMRLLQLQTRADRRNLHHHDYIMGRRMCLNQQQTRRPYRWL